MSPAPSQCQCACSLQVGLTNRHRPPASSSARLQERHVQPVNVRTFLSVHLDVHEVFIHYARDKFILETLVGEDMAPCVTFSLSEDELSLESLQWQAEYPTERNMGLSSLFALSNASVPHSYQSTCA